MRVTCPGCSFMSCSTGPLPERPRRRDGTTSGREERREQRHCSLWTAHFRTAPSRPAGRAGSRRARHDRDVELSYRERRREWVAKERAPRPPAPADGPRQHIRLWGRRQLCLRPYRGYPIVMAACRNSQLEPTLRMQLCAEVPHGSTGRRQVARRCRRRTSGRLCRHHDRKHFQAEFCQTARGSAGSKTARASTSPAKERSGT